MHEIVYFYPKGHQAHYEVGHPERPERVETIKQALEAADLWDRFPQLQPVQLTNAVLTKVHSPSYLTEIKRLCEDGQPIDMDTYTTPATWQLSLNAAGGAAAVASMVWQRKAKRGFALSRPPGHHATRQIGMGFCILNNVALAAEQLISVEGARRLAIVDFDLHHGNGTQDIFWERGNVFFISIHQSPLYPGSGALNEIGAGEGAGKTLNLPLPPGSGDQAFNTCLQEVIFPVLDRYQPEMILVSYGFDPHWRDPLGHLMLSAAGYGQMIGNLVKWVDAHCQGRIMLNLEGGYDLEAAAACSLSVVSRLLGGEWEDSIGVAPHPEGQSWQAVIKMAKEIWKLN
jgi:acetoin utilization deacetylase AcuC-like enzyme